MFLAREPIINAVLMEMMGAREGTQLVFDGILRQTDGTPAQEAQTLQNQTRSTNLMQAAMHTSTVLGVFCREHASSELRQFQSRKLPGSSTRSIGKLRLSANIGIPSTLIHDSA